MHNTQQTTAFLLVNLKAISKVTTTSVHPKTYKVASSNHREGLRLCKRWPCSTYISTELTIGGSIFWSEFSLSLCGPNSISRANAHMVYMGRKTRTSHYPSIVSSNHNRFGVHVFGLFCTCTCMVSTKTIILLWDDCRPIILKIG